MTHDLAHTATVASFCTGVGMLDEGLRLGLEYFGIRAVPALFCEWESYAASVLLARMEDAALEPAPIYCGDLAEFDGSAFAGKVDCVVAGFPCQPWSCAGQQQGTDDERWLWDDLRRIIVQLQPSLVFVENVPGLVSGGGLHHVLGSLAEVGFDAEWGHLTAESVGANHKRERVFVLAYRGCEYFKLFQREAWAKPPRSHGELDNSTSARRKQEKQGTDERVAGKRGWECVSSNGRGNVGDAECSGRSQSNGWNEVETAKVAAGGRGTPIFAPGPSNFDGWNRVVADGSFDFRAPAIKPGVRVLVDGVALVVDASRADQLRCVGNGVVPLQAAAAFCALVNNAMTQGEVESDA